MYANATDERDRLSTTAPPAWRAPAWVESRPFATVLALIGGVIAVVAGSAAVLAVITPDLGEQSRRQIATLILAALTVMLLFRWSAWRAVGAAGPVRRRDWGLMALPLAFAAWPLGFGVEGGVLALVVALAAELPNSFAEEALMRGVLIRALGNRKRWATALISGVTFGLLHLVVVVWGAPAAEVVPLIVISSLFGIGYACMRMVTDSLWAPIALHALFNVSQHVGRGIESIGEGPATLILLVGAVVVPFYGLLLLRQNRRG